MAGAVPAEGGVAEAGAAGEGAGDEHAEKKMTTSGNAGRISVRIADRSYLMTSSGSFGCAGRESMSIGLNPVCLFFRFCVIQSK